MTASPREHEAAQVQHESAQGEKADIQDHPETTQCEKADVHDHLEATQCEKAVVSQKSNTGSKG